MVKNSKCLHLILLLCFLYSPAYVYSQENSVLQLYKSGNAILYRGVHEGNVDKIREAIALFHRGLDINKNYFDVLYKLSVAYYILGEFTDARAYLEKAKQLHPTHEFSLILEILLSLQSFDVQLAYELIQAAKEKYPYNINLMYAEMIYFSVLGDMYSLNTVVDEMIRKHGADNVYLNIYKTILAIVTESTSPVQDVVVSTLNNQTQDNIWIQWLLVHYYLITDNPISDEILQTLTNTSLAYISTRALELQYLRAYNNGDYEKAIDIATRYTQKYEIQAYAWYMLGIAYYRQQDYVLAERSIMRSLAIDNDEFVLFVYDTILREGDTQLTEARTERVSHLIARGGDYIADNNFMQAIQMVRRALYIDPLNIGPRRMLVTIYRDLEDYSNALREIAILRDLQYEEDFLDAQMTNLRALKEHIITTDLEQFGLNTVPDLSEEKVWNIELGAITQKVSKDTVIDTDFQRKLFEYYLSQSSEVNWTLSSSRKEAEYMLSIEFYPFEQQRIIIAHLELRHKDTHKLLLQLDQVFLDRQYLSNIFETISKTLDERMPKILYVLALYADKILLDVNNQQQYIEIGATYNLYKDKNSFVFQLDENIPHYLHSTTHIATVTVDDIIDEYAVGTVTMKTDSENLLSFNNTIRSITRDDFVIVPPDWENVTDETKLLKSTSERYARSRINDYLLHVLFIDDSMLE